MKNPIQELNEHCQKCRLPLPSCEFIQLSVTPSTWEVSMRVGDVCATKTGETKKAAQTLAAENIIEQLIYEEIWWEQLYNTPIPKGVGGYRKPHKVKQKIWDII